MNTVHKDGRALLTLSNKMEGANLKEPSDQLRKSEKRKPAAKPVPPPSVQQQDTDYDVKPEMPTPKPTRRDAPDQSKHARADRQYHAAASGNGGLTHATQMGESEGSIGDDVYQSRVRALRAFCS